MKLLGVCDKDELNDDGVGIVEFSTEEIARALKEAKAPESKKVLQKMQKDAKANDGWAQYYCF